MIYKRYTENNKNLRLWSAGCSSGEEPYSIAILLHKLIPDIKDWNITLLATDINTMLLNKLAKGVYSEWSFRNVPSEIKTLFFIKKEKNNYEILHHIKKLVTPFYLNLCRDNYPSLSNNTNAMDIIFCRNVMMYFSPVLIQEVAKKFHKSLANEGCLIVGPSEGMSIHPCDFKVKIIHHMPVFIKENNTKKNNSLINSTLSYESISTKKSEENKVLPMEKKAQNIFQKNKILMQNYANQGDLKEALLLSEKAIADNKIDAELYYLQACIFLELGRKIEAVSALKNVLYLDQNHILTYIALGNIFLKNKKESCKFFDRATALLKKLNPEDIIADMTVRRLIEIISSMNKIGKSA